MYTRNKDREPRRDQRRKNRYRVGRTKDSETSEAGCDCCWFCVGEDERRPIWIQYVSYLYQYPIDSCSDSDWIMILTDTPFTDNAHVTRALFVASTIFTVFFRIQGRSNRLGFSYPVLPIFSGQIPVWKLFFDCSFGGIG